MDRRLIKQADDCSGCGRSIVSKYFDSPLGLFSLCPHCDATDRTHRWQVYLVEEAGRVVDAALASSFEEAV